MTLTNVDKLYWAVGYAGNIILLLILISRHRARIFPIFTSLIAFNIVRTTILLCVRRYGTPAEYFYTYWQLFAIDITLQLLVVYEIAASVFRPLGYWAQDVRRKAMAWTVISAVIAVLLTWLPQPAVSMWFQTIILKASFFVSILECELFIGLAVLSWEGGFPWNSLVSRVAIGFVLFAFPDMVVEIATTWFGLKNTAKLYESLEHVRMTAYICSLLYWNVALWIKAQSSRRMSDQMHSQLEVINQSVSVRLQTLKAERES